MALGFSKKIFSGRLPATLRMLKSPKVAFRRFLLFGGGPAGYGNAILCGAALSALIADWFNLADAYPTGKIVAFSMIAAPFGGLIIGVLFAFFMRMGGFMLMEARTGGLVQAIRTARPSFGKVYLAGGRALWGFSLMAVIQVLESIMLGENTYLAGGPTPVAYVFGVAKVACLLLTVYLASELVQIAFKISRPKAIIIAIASLAIAISLTFFIFLLLFDLSF